MTRRALFLASFVLVSTASSAQQDNASAIDGVWKIAERTQTGANASSVTSPQPSLVIFTRGYYSWLSISGNAPRKQSAPPVAGKMTDADKVARYAEWDPLNANSGTFEIKGSSLTTRVTVAKNVGVMAPNNSLTREFKLEGDNLWITQRVAGDPSGELRWRLTRVR
jgi:hypothetical protein